jgi:galactose oxidase-like protein/glyoxal oxidase-like protein/IPT/TIG domain-containing protein
MNKRFIFCLALTVLFQFLSASAQQATMGQWQNGPNFPFFPVHMHMLPSGKILIWPGDGGVSGNDPRLYDPATGSTTAMAQPGYDVFCSGHSLLPDGRLFVAGGHISNNVGLSSATIYDPPSNTWTRQPNMNLGRWYPTTQVLPNGDVVVVSGDVDLSTGNNPLPQVWQASTGTWRSLTNAQLQLGLYPTLSLAPNGMVFDSGPTITTRYLNTAGTGAWTTVGNHVFQGIRDYDSMVMYQPGKVLVAGGSDPPTNTAEVIDLNAFTPAWRAVNHMAYARRQMNATVLPDGRVLVTGGTSGPGFNNSDAALAAYAAEQWDPVTEQWTTLASATLPRLYHSMAMLLPDGRVLVTGGNGYTQTEIFSPPYLFAGARPRIASVPTDLAIGQTVFVGTPDATNITSVAWVRLESISHGLSMSQAFYNSTAITQVTGGINIKAPNDSTLPLGYYMLFILNHGVPSVASIVHLGLANRPAPVTTSLNPSSANNGDYPFVLTVNGSAFSNDSVVRWNGSPRSTTSVSATQLTANIPASDLATAGTAQVTVFTPAPGGGTSSPLTFTINQAPVPNLTQTGTIIAKIMAPTGGGNHNPEVIRDGDKPPVGTNDSSRQYDTYHGGVQETDDWIGYQYSSTQTFAKVVFQEGMNFVDGGWFNNLNVQVRQSGNWVNVSNITSTPSYPPNDNISYETYTLQFSPISGDAIRIDGAPGGAAYFISVGELQVFGPGASSPAPSLTSMSPTNANSGDLAFKLTVNGSNFVSGSTVQWNGSARPTSSISATQLTANIPASDVTTAGTAQVTVFTPAPGGGTSSPLTFTINQSAVTNLTQAGTIIAKTTAPTGGGNHNPEVIRDGDMPPVGTKDSSRQYDTYHGGTASTDEWIGYQYPSAQTFTKVVFQEGMNFVDGGWFNNLNVQVRQSGNWANVSNLTSTPSYPPNDNVSYETYTLQFSPISGDAIRIDGAPGGAAYFISVGELQVYGSGSSSPAPSLASMSPTSANSGGSPFTLTVNGTNFVAGSVVRWNGSNRATSFVSATQLTANIPASDVATASTAQVTVFTPAPGGGTSSALTFTVNQATVTNLTQTGTIIAKTTAPTGGGNHNIEIIRNGDMPPVGTNDSSRQYDSYHGGAVSTDEWIGYQYTSTQTFAKVVFQEGMNFVDGGWFNNLNVQVRQSGNWVNVSNITSTPSYPPNDNISYETYTFQFSPISGDAIRIDGAPGGSAYFISVGELQVYGP